MSSITVIVSIASAGEVFTGSSRRTAAANASSWYAYVARRGNFSVRRSPPIRTTNRWYACGISGLKTLIDPRDPITFALIFNTEDDHSEHSTRPVWPEGNFSSAVMARSTRDDRSFADAETTEGVSPPPNVRAMW